MDVDLDAKSWSEKALTAVFCLWDHKRHQAWRGSQEHRAQQQKGAKPQFRPTATYNAVLAIGECGGFLADARFRDGMLEIGPLGLTVKNVGPSLSAEVLLRAFVTDDAWVNRALEKSEHGFSASAEGKLAPRAAMMIGRLVPAVSILARSVSYGVLLDLAPQLIHGLKRVVDCLTKELFPNTALLDEAPSTNPATISPQIIVHAAVAVKEWEDLREYLWARDRKPSPAELEVHGSLATKRKKEGKGVTPIYKLAEEHLGDEPTRGMARLLVIFRSYFARQVDRQMARKHVPLDPDYDVASLAFSTHGLALVDDSVRASPFFRSCVAAVVEGQNPDGCWPEGMTVASHESSDAPPVRQPSVEIALSLADSVFRRSQLFRCLTHEIDLLDLALPSLKRQLRYLAASFQVLPDGYTGWADDRLRAPGEVRMPVNATAARLIHRIRLAEIACERAKTLERYRPEWPPGADGRLTHRPEDAWKKIYEPDFIIKPCETIASRFIAPIAEQMRRGSFFLRPAKNGVSFIIYGPPGSGKTYLISQFARALGWPLLSLNPGYFIEEGLESIEAVASRIFGHLMKLDHVVVFFDECDELFRDRSLSDDKARNILSFATASMLPKLQKLHDARKVIFILGTNYVRNIDLAIRRPGRFDSVLLLDRPDLVARLAISKDAIGRTHDDGQLLASEIKLAEKIAQETDGWMIEQIMSYSVALAAEETPQAPSTSDYADWCQFDGEKEIRAAGLGDEDREQILKRWSPHIKATEKVKQAPK